MTDGRANGDSGQRRNIAVDAMGGDSAPGEIVAGALQAAREFDVHVLLVGRRDEITPLLPNGETPAGVELVDASQVIAMDDEPLSAVRQMKDSSIVRAFEMVRDGRADAMVSAGNTGAVTTGAVLRLGRFKGVPSPAIAVPIPVPGHHPQLLVDGGAVVDPAPERLVQYALMGREYAQSRWDIAEPRIGLLSNGEEAGKGDELRKAAFPLLASVPGFVGNVEGRDFMHHDVVDVVVTDGFTGNVALKSLEGALRAISSVVFGVFEQTPEGREASKIVMGPLLEAANDFSPDVVGGAVLLGIKGITVISHGSSSARAITNAIKIADDCARRDMVDRVRKAVTGAG
ncbi:MAG: phosphate acyltransferase PlsX [Acidimicrobiia bacterium]|nr:phosphate acyltransferase PlsX [Acidimicrobiia bacterium]